MKTSASLKQLLKEATQKKTPEFKVVRHHYTIIDELVKAGQTFTSISQCLKKDGYHISAKKIKAYYEQIKREHTGTKASNKISNTSTPTHSLTQTGIKEKPQPHESQAQLLTQANEVEHQTEQPSTPPSRKERMERLRQQQQLNPDSVKPPPLIPIVDGEVLND